MIFLLPWILLFLTNCAHIPVAQLRDTHFLFEQACNPGKNVQKVKGSVWIKARSQEASGQFPALVSAESPDQLHLEVTNLLGGTEALIDIHDQKYSIQATHHKIQNQNGVGSWGGIPLHWGAELFLGKIPCPSEIELKKGSLSLNAEGDLVVDIQQNHLKGAQKYVYHFRNWGGTPWPETLTWQFLDIPSKAIEFKFDDPEDRTRSPRKWEAKSSRGEVKVRWKERDISESR